MAKERHRSVNIFHGVYLLLLQRTCITLILNKISNNKLQIMSVTNDKDVLQVFSLKDAKRQSILQKQI